MKRLFLILSLFGLLGAPALRAEVLESNVTLTYRLHAGHTSKVQGNQQVESYSIVSFKTSDIIHQIGLKTENEFSPRARLIHKTVTYGSGANEYFYIIRDPILGDFNATQFFELVTDVMSEKSKQKSDGTGPLEFTGHATFNIRLQDISEGLYGAGPATIKTRRIPSRQFPGTLLDPTTRSYTTYGHYKLGPPGKISTHYGSGTIKHSAPKITQTPKQF